VSAGKKIYQGVTFAIGASSVVGIFVLGYSAGKAAAGEFHTDVEKAAKRRIREAADKLMREEAERRKFDRMFTKITENQ
jgi:succinate dehydrogenase/fumarate reductase flavoprotein subunit